MDMLEIEKKIKEAIAEHLVIDIEEIANESRFMEDLKMDSLDAIEMIMEIEDVLDIRIPDAKAEKIICVQDVIDFVIEVNENRSNK